MRTFKRLLAAALTLAALLTAAVPAASAESVSEIQKALVETAFAFHYNEYMDYDSIELTDLSRVHGGNLREDDRVAPEEATPDHTVYSVCSSFCWEVYYNTLGFTITDRPSMFITELVYSEPPEGMVVYRHDNAEEGEIEKSMDEAVAALQVGDIVIVCQPGNGNGGHAMLYVGDPDGDGTPDMIHSGGEKYNMGTGRDTIEAKEGGGNILYEHCAFLDSAMWCYLGRVGVRYVILRPLMAGARDCKLTAAAKSRVKYPRMTIYRTVSAGPFGSAATGDTLTYTIQIRNNSDKAYSGLAVQETVPTGTDLAAGSVKGGGSGSGRTVNWTINVPAGETVTLSYDVKVTAKRGDTIVADGGKVADIPSNALTTFVRGKAADPAALQKTDYRNKLTGVGTDFAESVYREALGVELDLPTAREIMSNCFTMTAIKSIRLYELKDAVDAKYETVRKMMIPCWFGGRNVHTEANRDRILQTRTKELEPGDIVVASGYLPTDSNTDVFVYTGTELLASKAGKIGTGTEKDLESLLSKGTFFALRPSLVYDDMATDAKAAPKPISFPDVKSTDWFYGYVMDLAKEGIVGGMSDGTFQPAGTLTYGQALKLLICALDKDVGNAATGHWASGYLSAAQEKGWISGSVNLDAGVSRLAFCQIAAKAKGLTEQPAGNPFTDTSDPAVLALNKAGVIGGMGEGKFSPDTTLTRAQISKIIVELRKA